jgi:hypothetical protein
MCGPPTQDAAEPSKIKEIEELELIKTETSIVAVEFTNHRSKLYGAV